MPGHNATAIRGTASYVSAKINDGVKSVAAQITGSVDTVVGTVEFWVNSLGALSTNVVIGNNAGFSGAGLWIGQGSGGLQAAFGSQTLSSGVNIGDSVNHHVALTNDGTNVKLYLDGIQVATGASSTYCPSGLAWGGAGTVIGGFGTSLGIYDWPGWIDNLAIWSTVQYTGTFTPPATAFNPAQSNLIAYYTLDANLNDSSTTPSAATAYTLSPSVSSIAEGSPVTITATANGTLSTSLVITLVDSLASTISGTITIAAGSISSTATITPTATGTHNITASHTGGGFTGGDGSTTFTATTPGFSPGTITATVGTPSSHCVTIAVGTAPANATSPITYVLFRSFNQVDWYPQSQIVAGLPWTDDQVPPRSTLFYKAHVIDAVGNTGYTPVVSATTTNTLGTSKTLVIWGGNSQTAGDVGDLNEPTGHVTGWNSNTNGTLANGATSSSWLQLLIGDNYDVVNAGIDGVPLTNQFALNAIASWYTANPSAYPGGVIVILGGCINDLRTGAVPATLLTAYGQQVLGIRQAGVTRVIVETEIDVEDSDTIDSTSTVTETQLRSAIGTFNGLVRANAYIAQGSGGLGATGLLDLGANAIFGVPGAADYASWQENYGTEGSGSTVQTARRLHLTSKSNRTAGILAASSVWASVIPPVIGTAPSATSYTLLFPLTSTVGVAQDVGVLFNAALTAATTVTLTDSSATLSNGGAVVVGVGSLYGAVSRTPNSTGSHTVGVAHTGQVGISDPTSGLTVADSAVSGGGGTGATASQIATAVWSDLLNWSDFSITGSAGAALKSIAALTSASLDGGTVGASPSPTSTTFTASGALHAPSGGYNVAPMSILWQSGANQGQRFPISAHVNTGASHTFTVATMPAAPASGDTFLVV